MNQLAQKLIISEPSGAPIEIQGPLVGINKIADIINIVVKLLFPLAGILLFFFLVWGGYNFLVSGGDPEKVKAGKAKITSALIGFVLLVLSYFITSLIARIFGLGGGSF